MNSNKSSLEDWLAEISAEARSLDDIWDPGFEAGLEIVIAELGPLRKTYRRPAPFTQRFYHQVYPLPIEEWQLSAQTELYGGFCSIEAKLSIRFQASVKYAQAHAEALPAINESIKANYESLIRDAVDQEFRELEDGEWIENGLSHIEKRLQTYINETLAVQYISCRTMCTLLSTFTEPADNVQPDERFAREDIYVKVLKKQREIRERQEQERFRQEQILRRQQMGQQQRLMQQHHEEEELKRREQAQTAADRKRQLEDQERQLIEHIQLEERLHRKQVLHRQRMQALDQEAELEILQQQQRKKLQLELQLEEERLEQQRQLQEKQLAVEIEEFTRKQAIWNETNERIRIEKIQQEERLRQMESEAELKLQEKKIIEEQRLQELLQEEKLKHESRLKERELQMEIQEQKKRYDATQEVDEYLRHDIELLILEKHRSELVESILKSKQNFLSPHALPPGTQE